MFKVYYRLMGSDEDLHVKSTAIRQRHSYARSNAVLLTPYETNDSEVFAILLGGVYVCEEIASRDNL